MCEISISELSILHLLRFSQDFISEIFFRVNYAYVSLMLENERMWSYISIFMKVCVEYFNFLHKYFKLTKNIFDALIPPSNN